MGRDVRRTENFASHSFQRKKKYLESGAWLGGRASEATAQGSRVKRTAHWVEEINFLSDKTLTYFVLLSRIIGNPINNSDDF
jgi:hypothetical protein